MATPTTLPASFTAGQILTAAQMNNLRGAFRVLQLVNTLKSDTFSTTSTSLVDVTGLSATITPSSTTSKIMVMVTLSGVTTDQTDSSSGGYVLLRDSTQIAVNTALAYDRTGQLSIRSLGASTAVTLNHATNFLDSPATVSALTYKVQVVAGAGTLYVNRDGDNAVGSVSTLTLMEISA
jgi:hypothetical protein